MIEKHEHRQHRTGAATGDLERLRAEFAALVSLLPIGAAMAEEVAASAPLPNQDEVEDSFDNMPV